MARVINNYALGAKMIRQWLKAQNIPGRVVSEGYSMGSSINVYLEDQLPEVVEKVEAYAKRFQYGHFDGQQDLYEYSNVNDKLPQATFVFVKNELSNELRQNIWDFILTNFVGMGDAPIDAQQAWRFRLAGWGIDGAQLIYRMFSGGFNDNQYWDYVAKQNAEVVA